MKTKKRRIKFFLIFILISILFLQAEEKPKLKILSKAIVQKGNRVRVSGDIKLIYGSIVISGKTLEYSKKTETGIIEDEVEVIGKDILIRAEKIEFDLKKKKIVGREGFGYIGKELIVKADDFIIKDGEIFKFKRGAITCCIQANPRWSLFYRKAYLKKNDHVSVWGAGVKIKNIPIFYLPYFYYPIKEKKRKTGFLFPYIGYSNFKGYMAKESFFWAIKENLDLTLNAVYYSKLGKGGEAELRFADWWGNYLRMKGVFLENNQEGVRNYILNGDGKINFSQSFYISLKSNLVSSTDFLRDYSENFNFAMARNFYSSFYAKKSFRNFQASLFLSQSETHYSYRNYTYKIRYLPKAEFSMLSTPIFGRYFYLSFKSGYSNPQRFLTDEWISAERFYFKPTVQIPLPVTSWLTMEFNLKGNYNYYKNSYNEKREIIEEPLFTDYTDFTFKISGPVFYKIFNSQWSGMFLKVKHLIEPSMEYRRTVFSEEKVNRAVRVEFSDYYYYYHELRLSLTQRFIGKSSAEGSSKEFFSFEISQNYYFDPEKQRITFQKPPDVDVVKWSELRTISRIYLGRNLYFSLSSSYNHYYKQLSNISLSSNVSLFENAISFNFSYLKRNYLNTLNYNISYDFLRAGLNVSSDDFPLKFYGFFNYDVKGKKIYSAGANIFLKFQCIGLKIDIMKIGYRVEGDYMIRFSILPGNITPSVNLF